MRDISRPSVVSLRAQASFLNTGIHTTRNVYFHLCGGGGGLFNGVFFFQPCFTLDYKLRWSAPLRHLASLFLCPGSPCGFWHQSLGLILFHLYLLSEQCLYSAMPFSNHLSGGLIEAACHRNNLYKKKKPLSKKSMLFLLCFTL